MDKQKRQLIKTPLDDSVLEQIACCEQRTAIVFKEQFNIELDNDEESIECLSDFINAYRNKFDSEAQDAWYKLIGSFLGQTIIAVYGGRWIKIESSSACVELNDGSICFPFDKVAKQLDNGAEDSIHYYFNFTAKILNKTFPFQ